MVLVHILDGPKSSSGDGVFVIECGYLAETLDVAVQLDIREGLLVILGILIECIDYIEIVRIQPDADFVLCCAVVNSVCIEGSEVADIPHLADKGNMRDVLTVDSEIGIWMCLCSVLDLLQCHGAQ